MGDAVESLQKEDTGQRYWPGEKVCEET